MHGRVVDCRQVYIGDVGLWDFGEAEMRAPQKRLFERRFVGERGFLKSCPYVDGGTP